MLKPRIILSGGGTGGHIFPAVSIARKIKDLLPDAEILFVGAKGKMEMEKVPEAGFKIIGLPVSAFHRSLTLKNLVFPFKLAASLLKARRIIADFKPGLVIGTGGFASGPIVNVAAGKSIPCLLQEQNAFPGVTNRMLGKKVNKICVAHEGMEKYFPREKIILTGNPVREEIATAKISRSEALGGFNLSGNRPVVLVFGGSLGARTLNNTISSWIKDLASQNIDIIWQTGTAYFSTAAEDIKNAGANNIRAFEFISRMDCAYEAADVIISRAGAISISELCIAGKPVILVPYPFAAGNHQYKNARSLVDVKAAMMVEDKLAVEQLIPELYGLIKNKEGREEMSRNIVRLGKPDASLHIAQEAIKLLKME